MVVDNRQTFGVIVVQPSGRVAFKQEVLVYENIAHCAFFPNARLASVNFGILGDLVPPVGESDFILREHVTFYFPCDALSRGFISR